MHIINPDEKNSKNWFLDMARKMEEEWKSSTLRSFAKGADRYRVNRSYSKGKQNTEKYKEYFAQSDDPRNTYAQINFAPIPIIPKFRRIVNNLHGKLDFAIEAEAIDPLSMSEKHEYEQNEAASIQTREDLGGDMDTSGLDTGELDQPKTMDELAIKMEFSYKHNTAIDIEKRISAAYELNRVPESLATLRDNLFDCGVAGLRDWTCEETGEVKVRVIKPDNLICSMSDDQFFRDITWAGEIIYPTLGELRKTGYFTEPELRDIEKLSVAKGSQGSDVMGLGGNSSPWSKASDDVRVAVWDLEFQTSNIYAFEERTQSLTGNPIIGKTKWDKLHKDNPKNKIHSLYNVGWKKCKYIVGSKYVYEYGDVLNQKSRKSQLWDSIGNFHIAAPEIDEMETTSMVDHLIPLVDEIHKAWYKLQNAINKARPKGVVIEIGALEDVSLGGGEDGEAMEPLEIMDLFDQTGMLVYRRLNPDGDTANYDPIKEIENGLGQEAERWFGVINQYFQMIREWLGFNDITDASTPDARMLNGVAEFAAQSTNNAINHLLSAERSIIERLADSIALRVHDSIIFNGSDVYDNVIGSDSSKSDGEDTDLIHREYGIIIRQNFDPQEEQRFSDDIRIAIESGQVTIADKIKIMNVPNIKEREQVLAHIIKENDAKRQQEAQANTQAQSQAQAEAAKVIESEKRTTVEMEAEIKERVARATEEEKRKTLEIEWKYKLELEKLKQEVADNKTALDSMTKIATESMREDHDARQQERQMSSQQQQVAQGPNEPAQ